MKENRTAERTNTGLKRSNLFMPKASPSPLLRKNQILSKWWPRIDPRHFAHSSFDGTHLILEPEYQVDRFFAKITDDESRSVYFAEKSPLATLGPRTGVLPPAPQAPWAKIGLVNLGKGPGFLRRLHHSAPQALIDPLAGLMVDPSQFARRQRRYVRQNIFNNSLNLRSEILATKIVCH